MTSEMMYFNTSQYRYTISDLPLLKKKNIYIYIEREREREIHVLFVYILKINKYYLYIYNYKDTFCFTAQMDGQWPNEPKTINLLKSVLPFSKRSMS